MYNILASIYAQCTVHAYFCGSRATLQVERIYVALLAAQLHSAHAAYDRTTSHAVVLCRMHMYVMYVRILYTFFLFYTFN